MHEGKDTSLPSQSTVANSAKEGSAKEGFPIPGKITNSQAERDRGEIFSSVSNLMNEVLINIMALINGERD